MGADTLFLVRHARPLIEPGICYGQLDVAADADATRVCAEALAGVLPRSITVVCSPLSRCEHLAQTLIGLRADLTYKTDARLKEMDFGQWEGRRWDDIGAAALDAWAADFQHHTPGGGESMGQFMQRVAAAWEEPRGRSSTLWITHAGVIRATVLLRRGQSQIVDASQWPIATPGFGRWIQITTP